DAARRPVRDPHRDRARRVSDVQGLPQPARELDLDRRCHIRARHARRDVAAPGAAMNLCRAARVAALLWIGAAAALAQPAPGPPGHPATPAAPDVPAGDAAVIGRLVHPTHPDAVANVDILLYA